MPSTLRFAGYPAALGYARSDGKGPADQLLWGSPVDLLGQREGKYELSGQDGEILTGAFERCRPRGPGDECWIREGELQEQRTLEVTFVDVGTGDGTLLIAPCGERILVDSAAGDTMQRYLDERFKLRDERLEFAAAVISHPDSDHYCGFFSLLEDPRVHVDTLYINGIVDRFGKDSLGRRFKDGERSFIGGLVTDTRELEAFLAAEEQWTHKTASRTIQRPYPRLLERALDSGRVDNVRMLSTEDGYLPGFGTDEHLSIQVLGPVVEGPERPRLRWLGTVRETKNGHSIVLRVMYGEVSLLLGGAPGAAGETHLLEYHTGLDTQPENPRELERLVAAARPKLQSDVAKLCHHGGRGLTEAYLRSVNAAATIASLGYEGSNRMRPETLGLLGRHGRGSHPLVFSSSEFAYGVGTCERCGRTWRERVPVAAGSSEVRRRPEVESAARTATREDPMAVFGAIHFVTDGQRIVIARRLEQPRSRGTRWALYPLEPDDRGRLRYLGSARPRPVGKKEKKECPLWRPKIKVEKGLKAVAFRKSDVYAAVDEILGEEVIFSLTSWPRVDARGRLMFDAEGERSESWPLAKLQAQINRWRKAGRQVLRPLRTGDVFRIRFAGDLERGWQEAEAARLFEPEAWELLHDVTARAREAAKMALAAAITPPLQRQEAKDIGLSPEPPPAGRERTAPLAATPGSVARSDT